MRRGRREATSAGDVGSAIACILYVAVFIVVSLKQRETVLNTLTLMRIGGSGRHPGCYSGAAATPR